MNPQRNELYKEIPAEVLNTNSENAKKFVGALIKSLVPPNDYSESDFNHSLFVLNTANIRKPGERFKKRILLSRKQRQELNLLKCPKEGWNYEDLQPLRELWRSYMEENLKGAYESLTRVEIESCDMSNMYKILAKSEYNGAEMKILRARNSSVVGLTGTCIIDTKNTFKFVTKDNKCKTVPKVGCYFEVDLGRIKLTAYGKYMTTRPAERSVKKLKSLMIPDL